MDEMIFNLDIFGNEGEQDDPEYLFTDLANKKSDGFETEINQKIY
ncbi:MAG TPA: hypothetical protein VK664_14795 [Flavitalea sp.]|nr:hypothetical protein [Flavitalea sp.]